MVWMKSYFYFRNQSNYWDHKQTNSYFHKLLAASHHSRYLRSSQQGRTSQIIQASNECCRTFQQSQDAIQLVGQPKRFHTLPIFLAPDSRVVKLQQKRGNVWARQLMKTTAISFPAHSPQPCSQLKAAVSLCCCEFISYINLEQIGNPLTKS